MGWKFLHGYRVLKNSPTTKTTTAVNTYIKIAVSKIVTWPQFPWRKPPCLPIRYGKDCQSLLARCSKDYPNTHPCLPATCWKSWVFLLKRMILLRNNWDWAVGYLASFLLVQAFVLTIVNTDSLLLLLLLSIYTRCFSPNFRKNM